MGTYRLCCEAEGAGERAYKSSETPFKIFRDQALDALNCDGFKEVRLQMLEGKVPKTCERCHSREMLTGSSSRHIHLKNYPMSLNEARHRLSLDGSLLQLEIESADLRLGNICNLRCRMCNPWSSSALRQEFSEIFDIHVDESQWPEESDYWMELIQSSSKLKDLYLTGGEPTLIKNNERLLRSLSQDVRDQLRVRIHTNATIYNDSFYHQLNLVKTPEVNISLDGVGKINDFIRFPSRWENIKANIQKIREHSNIKVNIHLTISNYNILSLSEILDGFKEQGLGIPTFDFAYVPAFLNIEHLPERFREIYLKRIKPQHRELLRGVDVKLSSKADEGIFKEFILNTDRMDVFRKQEVGDYLADFKIYKLAQLDG